MYNNKNIFLINKTQLLNSNEYIFIFNFQKKLFTVILLSDFHWYKTSGCRTETVVFFSPYSFLT